MALCFSKAEKEQNQGLRIGKKYIPEKLLLPVEWHQNARVYVGRSALPVGNAEGARVLHG